MNYGTCAQLPQPWCGFESGCSPLALLDKVRTFIVQQHSLCAYNARYSSAWQEAEQSFLRQLGTSVFHVSQRVCCIGMATIDQHSWGGGSLLAALQEKGLPIHYVVFETSANPTSILAVTHTEGWPIPDQGWWGAEGALANRRGHGVRQVARTLALPPCLHCFRRV